MCVCVHFEVLLGAARGLRSTLGFNGSPHHRSASSYLLPCRRAVASSRWLIREAGNIFQISPPPHPHTDTHTHNPPTPNTPQHNHTFTDTHSGVWTNVSIWANFRAREEKICLSHAASVYRFSFCTYDKKINCSLENVFCFRVVLIMIKDREGE